MKKSRFFACFFTFKLLIIVKKNVIIIRYRQEDVPLSKREETQKKTNTTKKESSLVTKESLCAVGALFSALAFLILCTNEGLFGATIGGTIFDFLIGVFGLCAYPVFLATFYVCGMGLIGKRLVKNRKAMTFFALGAICLAMIIHTVATYSWTLDGYIAQCFDAPALAENATVTVTGWFGGIVVYLLSVATTKIGAIIILSVCVLFFGYLSYITWKNGVQAPNQKKTEKNSETAYGAPVEIPLVQPTQSAQQMQQVQASQTVAPQPQSVQQPSAPTYTGVNEEAAYGIGNVDVMQQPAFSLSDENQTPVSQQENVGTSRAFSPFGTAENMQNAPTDDLSASYANSREFLFGATPAENYKRNLIFDPNANVNKRVTPSQSFGNSYAESYQNSVNAQPSMPAKVFTDRSETYAPSAPQSPQPQDPAPRATESLYTLEQPKETPPVYTEREPLREDTFLSERETESRTVLSDEQKSGETEYRRHSNMDLFSPSNPNVFGNSDSDRAFAREAFGERENAFERNVEEKPLETKRETDRDGLHLFDEDENDNPYTIRSEFSSTRTVETPRDILDESHGEETSRLADRFSAVESNRFERETPKETPPVTPVAPVVPIKSEPPAKETPPEPPKPRIIRPYVKPRLDDFDCRDVEPVLNPEEVEETKQNILATLEDFKVSGATIASTTFGPTVTRYNVTIPRNIPPQKVVALDQPIAISLRSSGVNIYPNYEDGVVSIEVPNKERQFVQLGCMLSGDTFVNAKSSSIMFTMGKDAGNRKVYGDISKMIHMLVAGSSGSGKSVFLGSLIISLIYKYSPEELRLILIDPKKTEFVLYNNLPHLMINEIITEAPKAVQSLNWAIGEMNRRYGLFEKMSRAGTYVVNLDQYNAHVEKAERLPKIVIIIDELADLMLAAKKDIEDKIQNLTQKARAAGIHLVVATQRPSTDVITGVIKSNLPTRIAFAVATDVDSRVILDQTGAQKLLGKGDFLYTMQGINTPVRVQSAFISAEDSQRIVNFIKANNEAYYDETATAYINNARGGGSGSDSFGDGEEVEPVYIDALRYVILSNSASISLIQRKCSIGYNKAGKIVEWMEEMGYISSFEGAKARKVLISKEEFESKYGSL